MSDLAALKHDTGYVSAMHRLWSNVTERKMYITGGIGSSARNEGFTADFDLPNKEAYCETCASVGMVYWNQRMNQFTGNGRYIDILERCMYNGALAGVSLSGDRFFYVNPLESDGNHHRQAWYGCACCPSQISRFLPSIGNYIYGVSDDALWVNLFIGNETEVKLDGATVKLTLTTLYPWQGEVSLSITSDQPLTRDLRVRIPGWCKHYSATANRRKLSEEPREGYLHIACKGSNRADVKLQLDMPVEMVQADPRVKQDVGKRALQRGPLVYCMEETDNAPTYAKATLNAQTRFTAKHRKDLLGGVTEITAGNGSDTYRFVPYYAWDNREAGRMKVWIDYQE